MKKLLKKYGYMILFIVLVGGAFAIADDKPIIKKPSEIVCPCGCEEKDVQCLCPTAKDALEKFKGV